MYSGHRPAPHPADGRAADGCRRPADAALAHARSRSGQPRSTPLLYTRHGRRYVVVASKAGADRHPAWYHSLRAHPNAVTIEVGGQHIRFARARPKAPSVRNCGGSSMTTTTATRCTGGGRASRLSRSCCSNQRDAAGLPTLPGAAVGGSPHPAARNGDALGEVSECIAGSFTAARRRWCASRCREAAAGRPLPRRMPVSVRSPGRPQRRGPRRSRR